MSGVGFVDCNGGPACAHRIHAHPAGGGPRPRRIIDIHAHCLVPAARALVPGPAPSPVSSGPPPGLGVGDDNVAVRIAAMDAQGVEMQVLSINAFWHHADVDLSRQVIELQNQTLAEIVARHPDRLAAMATVALQHPQEAARQLEHAVKSLGLRGVLVGGSVEGAELSDPRFHPFWAKAEELGAPVFLHPQGWPDAEGRLRGGGLLPVVVGYPLETTVALSHLIYEGTLDRFPGLKLCAAHGGGFLPAYSGRFDAVLTTFPGDGTVKLNKAPSAYLRDLYYDSLVFTPEALRHLIAVVGADRVMLGSDYPFPWTDKGVDHVLDTPELTDAERAAILGETAARLFGIGAKVGS